MYNNHITVNKNIYLGNFFPVKIGKVALNIQLTLRMNW